MDMGNNSAQCTPSSSPTEESAMAHLERGKCLQEVAANIIALKEIRQLCQLIVLKANKEEEYGNDTAINTANDILKERVIINIDDLEKSHIDAINISTSLQNILDKMSDIQSLQINNRDLSNDDMKGFQYLRGLTDLELISNSLTTLPDAMRHMKNLKNIDITANRSFSVLPQFLEDIASQLIKIKIYNTVINQAPKALYGKIDPTRKITDWI